MVHSAHTQLRFSFQMLVMFKTVVTIDFHEPSLFLHHTDTEIDNCTAWILDATHKTSTNQRHSRCIGTLPRSVKCTDGNPNEKVVIVFCRDGGRAGGGCFETCLTQVFFFLIHLKCGSLFVLLFQRVTPSILIHFRSALYISLINACSLCWRWRDCWAHLAGYKVPPNWLARYLGLELTFLNSKSMNREGKGTLYMLRGTLSHHIFQD